MCTIIGVTANGTQARSIQFSARIIMVRPMTMFIEKVAPVINNGDFIRP